MRIALLFLFIASSYFSFSQYAYEVSENYPFGRLNPDAPEQLGDFADLIGQCECKSVNRIDQTTWADTVSMLWTFKYIMNGMGVQDETWKDNGVYAGSIRQFNADSSSWYVHYYTSAFPTPTLSSWNGGKKDGNIVLYKEQQAPNGMDGFYRITFYDMRKNGFNWKGEWVTPDESIVYPTWRIFCTKIASN